MKAMKSLGGKVATSKQVKDYLEEHPEVLPNMSAAERQRSIRGLRLWQVCELHSKNKYGEDVFAIPAEALPTGVRRHKDYFTARTKLECLNTICIGPSRATAEEAKTDYDTMRQFFGRLEQRSADVDVLTLAAATSAYEVASLPDEMLPVLDKSEVLAMGMLVAAVGSERKGDVCKKWAEVILLLFDVSSLDVAGDVGLRQDVIGVHWLLAAEFGCDAVHRFGPGDQRARQASYKGAGATPSQSSQCMVGSVDFALMAWISSVLV
eukprot:s702_g10.t1